MRDVLQTQHLAQVGEIKEQLPDTAIVFALMLLKNKTGEELGLSEFPGTVFVGVVAKGVLAGSQRDHRHIPWRFAGNHITSNTFAGSADSAVWQGFSTE